MAYVLFKPSEESRKHITYLPMRIPLIKCKEDVIFDWYKPEDGDQVYAMLKQAIDEGQTYPQVDLDEDYFQNFYLSHDVFVARCPHTGVVAGSFFLKPRFPGRSSHICNGAFLVQVDQRKKGIGEILFKAYLRVARDLGYKGSFFNLVYASNTGSLKLCRRLGFTEIGIVPKAGKLKDTGYTDAVQFYYDLTNLNEMGEPSGGWPK